MTDHPAIEQDDLQAMAVALAMASQELVDQIRPILAGQHPVVIGATLADLLAMLIAGLAPAFRDKALRQIVDTANKLVPVTEKMMFGEAGWPDDHKPKDDA